MRGKVNSLAFAVRMSRITPASAGKSRLCRNSYRPEKDHPRECGEKSIDPKPAYTVLGSPPRVRGKVGQTTVAALVYGITPADAGKRPQ